MSIAKNWTQDSYVQAERLKNGQNACTIFERDIASDSGVTQTVKFVVLAQSINTTSFFNAHIDPVPNLLKRLQSSKSDSIAEMIQEALADTSEKIYLFNQQASRADEIGLSVLIGAFVGRGDQSVDLYLNHLGSCRAYLIREIKTYPLTTDHSYIRFLLETGGSTWNNASRHVGKDDLTNYLGRNRYERGDSSIIHESAWTHTSENKPTLLKGEFLPLKDEDRIIFVATQPTDIGNNIQEVASMMPAKAVKTLSNNGINAAAAVYLGKPGILSSLSNPFRDPSTPVPVKDKQPGRFGIAGWMVGIALLGLVLQFGWMIVNPPPPPATATPTVEIGAAPSETVTAVITSTPVPSVSDTAMPSTESTATEEAGTTAAPPTQTRLPTGIPTFTSTPTPTRVDTATPEPIQTTETVSAETPTNEPPTTLPSENPVPVLISARQQEKKVLFTWTWSGIREGHQFEVSIFTKSESSQCIRKGAYDLGEVNRTLQQNGNQYSVSFDPINSEGIQGRSGEYLWCVTVLSNAINDNEIRSADTQSFSFDANAGRSESTPQPEDIPAPTCGGDLCQPTAAL